MFLSNTRSLDLIIERQSPLQNYKPSAALVTAPICCIAYDDVDMASFEYLHLDQEIGIGIHRFFPNAARLMQILDVGVYILIKLYGKGF